MRRLDSLIVLLVLLAGCGGPTPPSPTIAVIEVSASPAAVVGRPCTGCGPGSTDREAVATLTIRETAGVGGLITSISVTFRETGTNAVIAGPGEFSQTAVAQLAGTARLNGSATLIVPDVGVHYPTASAGRTGALTYSIRMRDDRGNDVTREIVVPVTTA